MKSILQAVPTELLEVVRIAVTNNFNCTPEKWAQVDLFQKQNPNKYFFINASAHTPLLPTINQHLYKAVITANPDLDVDSNEIAGLYDIDPEKIAFVRVKWLPDNQEIADLTDELLKDGMTVVITSQRFRRLVTLKRYTDRAHYEYSCSRFRLAGDALKDMEKFVDSRKNIYICDRSGLGCQGCGLCSVLTAGVSLPIKSLNLSSSGICPNSCPDCYAKEMQDFLIKRGQTAIAFDVIRANRKQNGRTKHIKEAKEKTNA